jgi:hypothetical protein
MVETVSTTSDMSSLARKILPIKVSRARQTTGHATNPPVTRKSLRSRNPTATSAA